MPWLVALLSISACGRTSGGPGPAAPIEAARTIGKRTPLPGLRDVACGPDACWALTPSALVRLGSLARAEADLAAWDTLRWTDGGLVVEGACGDARCAAPITPEGAVGATTPVPFTPPVLLDDPLPLAEEAAASAGWWNLAIANRWRLGFRRVIVGPGGGVISWSRGIEGAGQLLRTGPGRAIVRVPASPSRVAYPAWLALHPTGQEAYLAPWPSGTLTAFDPNTLATRWTTPIGPGAVGLFVDPDGRWLVAETGGDDEDRWVDWPLPAVDAAPAADPFRDEVLRDIPRPKATRVTVVDLAEQQPAAGVEGRYRRFLPRPDGGWLLATDEGVLQVP